MKKPLLLLLALLGCGRLGWGQSSPYYEFTDTSLGAYQQTFNSLSGYATASSTNGELTALPEVYAQAEFSTGPYYPTTIYPNTGSTTNAAYYHFGTNTDRALGGIAATSTSDGIGYVGIRLRNSSSVTIRNLELQYAMEQWYNSGRQDQAHVSVAYLTGTNLTSLLSTAGSWTDVPALGVDAPSTATAALVSSNGNSAANRRVRQATLTGLNLAPGQEILVRWGYVLNTNTNGNGLSIDDVVITPETNVFYSKTTGNLDVQATWGTNLDGSGTPPASFTADNQIFYVQGTVANADRITATATTGTLGTWTVSGTNSKVVVGVPASVVTGAAAQPAKLYVEYNKDIAVASLDVAEGSAVWIRRTSSRSFTLATLHQSSTVRFDGGTSTQVPVVATGYGNLVLTQGGVSAPKTLAGSLIVTGSLKLGGAGLKLGSSSLTLVRRDSLKADGTTYYNAAGNKVNVSIVRGYGASAYVITDGAGTLRQTVPNNGVDIVYPVGSSATSYTPMALRQTAANSEDVYGARVADNVYKTYSSSGTGSGAAVSYQNVKKTWLVDEEVAGSSNTTMTVQWNAADATGDFANATAHLNHYTGGSWDTNTATGEWGATTNADNSLQVSRAGITSFSPFAVSSRTNGVLPVQLVAFEAQRAGQQVQCAWTTASETSSAYFAVERSPDGYAYAELGRVAAAGSATSARSYAFADTHPAAALAYYRLRQVDADGTTTYSPAVAVAATEAGPALALPNPSRGPLLLVAPGITAAEVFNALGQVVQRQPALPATNALPLDLSGQPAGLYLVHLQTSQGAQVLRVVKQ